MRTYHDENLDEPVYVNDEGRRESYPEDDVPVWSVLTVLGMAVAMAGLMAWWGLLG